MSKKPQKQLPKRAKEVTGRLAGVNSDGYATSRVTSTRTAGGANIIASQQQKRAS